jgi:hypothetical protein
MTLNARASSAGTLRLLQELEGKLASKRRPSSKAKRALDAIIADLMRAAQVPGRYSYRKTSAGSFTGGAIGYEPFKRAIDGLRAEELVQVVSGTGGGTGRWWASRFRATDKLLIMAALHGVSPCEWSGHYASLPRPSAIPRPLLLRANSRVVRGIKMPGAEIRVNLATSPAKELAAQVNRLNAFFARVSIEPNESHFAFQRLFNQGDRPDFKWNKGGRLYSLGASYQQMKSADRKTMMLNRESVVEIDVRASHLTILHALLKQTFDPATDPYAIAGLTRDVAKAWVTMTLGYDRFQSRWSRKNSSDYRETTGRELQKDFPIQQVREKVTTAIPLLKQWPTCSVRWGDLQFVESCIIIDAIETLANVGVPALPVHDSIIVPCSQESHAKEVLTTAFKKRLGVAPSLAVK